MQATPAFRGVKPVAALQLLLQPPNTGPGCSGTTQKQCMECLLEKMHPFAFAFPVPCGEGDTFSTDLIKASSSGCHSGHAKLLRDHVSMRCLQVGKNDAARTLSCLHFTSMPAPLPPQTLMVFCKMQRHAMSRMVAAVMNVQGCMAQLWLGAC